MTTDEASEPLYIPCSAFLPAAQMENGISGGVLSVSFPCFSFRAEIKKQLDFQAEQDKILKGKQPRIGESRVSERASTEKINGRERF